MAAPRAVVTGSPAAPPRVGLVVSANTPTSTDNRWEGGIVYDPETGQLGYRTDDCEPGETDRDLPVRGPVEWDAYVVGDGIRCSTFGINARDWRAQVRRQLEAVAEFQISSELWSGSLAAEHNYPNLALTDGGEAIGTGNQDPIDSLALLEQYLAEQGGQRGMIHAPRSLVTVWTAYGMVVRDGGLLLTIHDTIVVPGVGYDAADGEAVATGMVEVRRGEVVITGDPTTDAVSVDRETNTVEVRAEQMALASWDGRAHGRVAVDLPDPATT